MDSAKILDDRPEARRVARELLGALAVMPVSALVVTLDAGERARRSVLYVLSRDPRVSVGEAVGERVPVVTETPTLEESEDVTEQLLQIPGVRFVDVVSIDFSDVLDIPQGSAGRTRRANGGNRRGAP
ncbi:MAG: hypothetical protein DYH12_22375 [Sorangiineae bacterium PRO1]|nr:hypothetical protein [Sorangiineae bacterium PRO1]